MWTTTVTTTIQLWLTVEAIFVVIFYRIWLPRFQKLRPPADYRGYSRDRRKLLCRILQRVEQTCRTHNTPLKPTLESYVRSWFHPVRKNNSSSSSSKSSASSSNNQSNDRLRSSQIDDSNDDSYDTIPDETFWPKRSDMDQFFAWAFFGRQYSELEDWMNKDMERMYETIETHYGLVFEAGSTPNYKPMRLSLDPLQPAYRPFFVYAFFSSMKLLAGLLLRAAGFYACKSSTGLMYFYRPERPGRQANADTTAISSRSNTNGNAAMNTADNSVTAGAVINGADSDVNEQNSSKGKLPLIFLHGIAPGGLFFYIPMLFFLGGDGRPLLFFENPDISFYILGGFPPNEHETVVGVWEAVDRHLGSTQEVSLIGHSFGSCPVTWLVHSAQYARIRQIVLVDPVSILLSEPDIIQNFLYQRHCLRKRKMPIKIGVVSNELFTEHYLRRHFSWYNSELWLEDLPDQAKVIVCLSDEDSIVPSEKVRREVLRRPDVDILVWENAGHAHCVTRPRTWKQIQMLMKRQEHMIFQESTSTPLSSSSSYSVMAAEASGTSSGNNPADDDLTAKKDR